MTDLQRYVDIGLEAVLAAENILLSYFQTFTTAQVTLKEAASTSKHHRSPVTKADVEAEELIKSTIKQYFPDHNFLGEETSHEKTPSPYTWIIDPIDGTREFIRGSENRNTLLALMHNDTIILGISHMPRRHETIRAATGMGTRCNGKRIHVSSRATLPEAYICHERTKYFQRDGMLTQLSDLCTEIDYAKSKTSYDFHRLAKGEIEAVIGPFTNLYDIAPFIVITQEAGGKATTISNDVIHDDYTSYCMSNGLIHESLLQYF